MKSTLASRRSSSQKGASLVTALKEKRLLRCRACGSGGLRTVLDLGCMPLANGFLTQRQLRSPEPRYPLELVFCPECALVQILETVPPEILFRHYLYFSSFSDAMLQHARDIATRMLRSRRLDGKSLVVEIASNDGYLLQFYLLGGIPVLGIEPAENIARAAKEERDVRTIPQFFSLALAQKLSRQGQRADVIHANNVLAHVSDLSGFLLGIGMLLTPDGVAVIEVPYVRELIERVEFDTIYHEHVSYFALTPLHRLMESHGLTIVDVERLEIHGGSLRIFVEHLSGRSHASPAVRQMLSDEVDRGLTGIRFYQDFERKVRELKDSLLNLLRGLKSQGSRIAAYGASAKGSTILNFFGIDHSILDFVVDRSTVKQGLYTPGTHLPIYNPEKLLEKMPDYVLLLTWNFSEEILEQQAGYRRLGGRFIIPIPTPQVI
jgi:SAM-dependent methyltransferase